MAKINTDERILNIIRSGEAARAAVDPDGLLSSGRISELYINEQKNSYSWTLVVDWQAPLRLYISGSFLEEGIQLSSITMYFSGEKTCLPVKGENSLLQSLGDLSGLPDALKDNLSFLGQKNAAEDNFAFSKSLYGLIKGALMYGVEGVEDQGFVSRFRSVCVSFNNLANGRSYGAVARCFNRSQGIKVTVEANIDVYGIRGKRVLLEYDFGMGHVMESDCFVVDGRKKVPSILLAKDLLGQLSNMYTAERNADKSLGQPKAEKQEPVKDTDSPKMKGESKVFVRLSNDDPAIEIKHS